MNRIESARRTDKTDTWRQLGAVFAGVVLILSFYSLDQTQASIQYGFVSVFTFSTPGEPYFWLSHALFLVPAAALIGYGLADWLDPHLVQLRNQVEQFDYKQLVAGTLCVGLIGAALVRLSRAIFLNDFALTDDENAARFGGQVLAGGNASIVAPALYEYMPRLFDYYHDGRVSSMEWLGGQLVMAISELGAGAWIHACLAVVPLVAVAILIGRQLGRSWALIAMLFLLFSPMSYALSMTEHTHLVSRAFVSLAILGVALGLQDDSRWGWCLAGFAFGAAFISRPMETATLGAPLAIYLIYRATAHPQGWKSLGLVLLGAALPLAAMLLHNAAVTGDTLIPPRFSGHTFADHHVSRGGVIPSSIALLWNRFGANLSYNLFMLAIWFLGPLGVLLVILGVLRTAFTKLLAAGVLLNLLLALTHDNHGVHHVGPIHYSEAVVPLAVIAVHGLFGIREQLIKLGIAFRPLVPVIMSICVVGLGLFNLWHAGQLHKQAVIHKTIYGFLDSRDVPRSVVLVPNYTSLWRSFEVFRETGSWVLQWRHNRPDLSDNALIVHDEPGAASLAARAYPDRQLLRLIRIETGRGLALVPVDADREPTAP